MKIATTLFFAVGAIVASSAGAADTDFTTEWTGGDVYIMGGAYEVTIGIHTAEKAAKIPAWSLTASAFKVNGKNLGRRNRSTLTLPAGAHLSLTFDLGPALVEANIQDRFTLSYAEGGPREVGLIKPAPAGLDFIDPSKIADKDLASYRVLLHTNQGDMLCEMYPHLAPNHVRNFLDLSYTGFYDGVIFHRVIPGFMIQGGDKTGTGRGDGPRRLDAEISAEKHVRGTLSMARAADPNSASCQFFVVHAKAPHLDGKYTIFGKLVTGFEALDAIANTPRGAGDRPDDEQKILSATVLYVAGS